MSAWGAALRGGQFEAIELKGDFELLPLMTELDYGRQGHTLRSELVDLGYDGYTLEISASCLQATPSALTTWEQRLPDNAAAWARYQKCRTQDALYYGQPEPGVLVDQPDLQAAGVPKYLKDGWGN